MSQSTKEARKSFWAKVKALDLTPEEEEFYYEVLQIVVEEFDRREEGNYVENDW